MSEQCAIYDKTPPVRAIATNCELCGSILDELDRPDVICSECRSAQAQAEMLGIPWVVDGAQFGEWLARMRFPAIAEAEAAADAADQEALRPIVQRVMDELDGCSGAPTKQQIEWVVEASMAQIRFLMRDGHDVALPGIGTLTRTEGNAIALVTE